MTTKIDDDETSVKVKIHCHGNSNAEMTLYWKKFVFFGNNESYLERRQEKSSPHTWHDSKRAHDWSYGVHEIYSLVTKDQRILVVNATRRFWLLHVHQKIFLEQAHLTKKLSLGLANIELFTEAGRNSNTWSRIKISEVSKRALSMFILFHYFMHLMFYLTISVVVVHENSHNINEKVWRREGWIKQWPLNYIWRNSGWKSLDRLSENLSHTQG